MRSMVIWELNWYELFVHKYCLLNHRWLTGHLPPAIALYIK